MALLGATARNTTVNYYFKEIAKGTPNHVWKLRGVSVDNAWTFQLAKKVVKSTEVDGSM